MSAIAPRKLKRSKLGAALAALALLTVGCGQSDLTADGGFFQPGPDIVTPVDAGVPALGTGTTGTGQDANALPAGNDAGTLVQMDGAVALGDAALGDASSDGAVSTGDAATLNATIDGAITSDAAIDGAITPDGAISSDSGSDAAQVDAALPRTDLGKGNGRDVVLIGDSWMSNGFPFVDSAAGGGISPALQNVSGQPYRNYAEQGVELLANNLIGSAIPTQWTAAVRADRNIKTVVMTGGGNDIILGPLKQGCVTGTTACTAKLAEIRQALEALWGTMAAAGVQDIVHIVYAKVAGDGVKDIDASNADLKRRCDAVPAPTRCHMFFTDSIVATKSDLVADGIHPKAASNTRIASAVFELMTNEGMRR